MGDGEKSRYRNITAKTFKFCCIKLNHNNTNKIKLALRVANRRNEKRKKKENIEYPIIT